MKEKVLSVQDTGRQTQKGNSIYQVVTSNEKRPIMTCFSKHAPELQGKEIEEGVDFTAKSSEYQGKTQWTMNLPSASGGGFQGKGGGNRYDPAMMNRAYAKDIVCEFIKLGKVSDTIDAASLVLDIEKYWKTNAPKEETV